MEHPAKAERKPFTSVRADIPRLLKAMDEEVEGAAGALGKGEHEAVQFMWKVIHTTTRGTGYLQDLQNGSR